MSEENGKFFLLERNFVILHFVISEFCDITAQNSKFFAPVVPIGTAGPPFQNHNFSRAPSACGYLVALICSKQLINFKPKTKNKRETLEKNIGKKCYVKI